MEQVSPTHLRCALVGQTDQDHRNRQANWYYFELQNLPREPVTIDLTNLAGEYSYQGPVVVDRLTRPVFSYDNLHWTHFDDSQVSWDDHEPRLTLHFTPARDHLWIAHTPAYTLTSHWLGSSIRFRTSPYPGKTQRGPYVAVAAKFHLSPSPIPKFPETEKKVIWLMFRQHAWETGSSWAGDGAIRFLLSADERARLLRDRVIYKIFPVADPDGVETGGVRFNKNGYDLNRNWDTIDARTMPEIAAQHKAILDWLDAGHHIDLFLSLHNTETGEYLEAPAEYQALGGRVFQLLKESTSCNPTAPLRQAAETTTPGKPGRMQVSQGLFHDRKLPAMVMEQMVDFNSRLGHYPQIADRQRFGEGLVQALAAALLEPR